MGPKALIFIHSLARKSLTKGQGSGITKIPSAMQAEAKASEIFTNLVEAGLKPEMMDDFIKSEADVAKYLNILDAYKRERMKPIPADSPRGKEITEALFGKRGTVVDMKGKVIPKESGIMGGESIESLMKSGDVTKKSKKVTDRDMFKAANENYITDTISKIKSMDPIEAMKEANKVIKREGPYKNLNQQQAKKILEDTEDHIFERDVTPMDEDFAAGGVAGLLGERTGYAQGTDVFRRQKKEIPEEIKKKIFEMIMGTRNLGKVIENSERTKSRIGSEGVKAYGLANGGRAEFKGGGMDMGAGSSKSSKSSGPAGGASSGGNYGGNNFKSDPDDNREQYGAQGQYSRPPSTPSDGGGDNKINLINTLNKFRPDTFVNPYNFSVDLNKNIGPFGLNSFINTLGILGIDDPRTPEDESEQDDYGISASYIRDLLGGDLVLGAGYSPTTGTNLGLSFSKQFNQGGRVNYNEGSLDPDTGSTGNAMLDFINRGGLKNAITQQYQTGGRVGLAGGMTRRAFLKLMGGVAAGIGAIKSGIIGAGKKGVAKKVVKEVIKTPPVAGKPEWFDALINKVILEGDDVTKKLATKDREIVHTKKLNDQESVTVTQDLDDGAIRVEYDSPDNLGQEPVMMQFKPGMADETTGGKKPADRFDVVETEPRYTGPDNTDIEFIGESGGPNISFIESDVTNLKTFATGKGPTMKEIVKSKKRKDLTRAVNENDYEAAEYLGGKYGDVPEPDFPDDYSGYASGGIAGMLGE
jgi:hypothetical protein